MGHKQELQKAQSQGQKAIGTDGSLVIINVVYKKEANNNVEKYNKLIEGTTYKPVERFLDTNEQAALEAQEKEANDQKINHSWLHRVGNDKKLYNQIAKAQNKEYGSNWYVFPEEEKPEESGNPVEHICVNFADEEVSAKAVDKLSRLTDIRRIEPLSYYDYMEYPHRTAYGDTQLRLGDAEFVIPPEFIMVTSDSTSTQIVTLRQENTQKEKHGHHRKTVLIDLVFSSIDQINGFKVPAPRHRDSSGDFSDYYYVDGLRQLLAEFKCTPFLPVRNYLLNVIHNIWVVALQAITISTVNGFPDVLRAQITLQAIEMEPYIGVPNVLFKEMIDWDLFRYYYQSFTTEKHRYKKLQSLPDDKRQLHFRISVLDNSLFNDKNSDEDASIIDVVTDTKIIGDRDSNYIVLVDSSKDDAIIQEFECGYSNILTNIQLSELSQPTVQFMGGMDTIYNITFRTTDENVIQQLQLAQTLNDQMIRQHPTIQGSIGFIKLESELVEFTGSLFVMVDSLTTSTIPGFPGTYNVQIHCVSFDIAQSEREELNGFRPFDDYLDVGTGVNPKDNDVYEDETITNDSNGRGLLIKVKQDLYAEYKFNNTELYPDLCLPTYKEINEFIGYLKQFRKSNSLSELPYETYPMNPVCSVHGQKLGSLPEGDSKGYMYPYELGNFKNYSGYVDPDFYVFYPVTFTKMSQESRDTFEPTKRESAFISGYEYTYPVQNADGSYMTSTSDGNSMVQAFINALNKMVGYAQYVMNAGHEGFTHGNGIQKSSGHDYSNDKLKWNSAKGYHELNGTSQPAFDCSGLMMYALNQVIPNGQYYSFLASTTSNSCILKQTDKFDIIGKDISLAQPGDIIDLGNSTKGHHVVAYVGNLDGTEDTDIIHAFGWNCGGSGIGVIRDKLSKVMGYSSGSWNTCYGIARCKAFSEYGTYVSNVQSGVQKTTTSDDNAVPLSTEDYKTICLIVASDNMAGSALESDKADVTLACAQYVYDKFTSNTTLASLIQKYGLGEFDDDISATVKDVFLNGKRMYENKISYMENSSLSSTDHNSWENLIRDNVKIGTVGQYIFFGSQESSEERNKSKTTKYYLTDNVVPGGSGGAYSITANDTVINPVIYTAEDIDNKFAEPLLVNVKEIGCTKEGRDTYIKNINTEDNWFNTSFHDQYQYSYANRLARAFPTYLLCFLDDDGAWYDGRKLWTNYYPYKSVIDIQVHAAYDMPVETATIVVSNSHRNLSQIDYGLSKYNIYNDKEIFAQNGWGDVQKWLYKYLAIPPMITSLGGAKLTSDMMRLHQIIYAHAKLREGTRVHLRIGYGSDPSCLATVMNGVVTECSIGDQISLVVSSDGTELISNIVSSSKKSSNNGVLGLFGLGVEQESSNIISEVMCKRQSWVTEINNKWFEASEYNIEHYGLYMGTSLVNTIANTNRSQLGGALIGGGAAGLYVAGAAMSSTGIGLIPGALTIGAGVIIGYIVGGSKGDENSLSSGREKVQIQDIWDGYSEQFDILSNIYKGGYKAELYIHPCTVFDGEDNIVYRKYNMTPWDVFVTMTNNVPQYIVKSSYFMFDSRLFFGLPFYMEKTRYVYLGQLSANNLWAETKAASQVHLIDSLCGIIDNQMKVSSKHTYTNVNVVFTEGSSAQTTGIIYSDASIDRSRQKTKILDTAIVQDALGPDWIYDKLGLYDVGWNAARRAGISELLYGWQQQYQGQIICMGQPGIKPQDHIILADHYAGISGICMVREVVHSMSINTGFTTSITPGMVACTTDADSGIISYMTTYLTMCESWIHHSMSRLEMVRMYESFSDQIAAIEYAREESIAHMQALKTWRTIGIVGSTASTLTLTIPTCLSIFFKVKKVGFIKAFADLADVVYNSVKTTYSALQTISTAKAATEGAGFISKLLSKLSNGFKAFRAGTHTAAAGAEGVSGLGAFVSPLAIALLVISVAIEHISRYISNLDTIQVIPLWKDGIPFVTNVKDGNSIVLTKNKDTGVAEDYEDVGVKKE